MSKRKEKIRVAQDRFNPEAIDFSKPVDITKFGSEDDPCFGKYYDLTVKQCKICGDADFCKIKMMHTQKVLREKVSEGQNFLDVADNSQNQASKEVKTTKQNLKNCKKYIKRAIIKGVKPFKIRKALVDN